ncbi:MAG: SH3 domain-containing protein [Oscillatoria sp. SIO1A7]|nr:SH3 domain-containing protein [Oscillatoria sp. SIO1A7]
MNASKKPKMIVGALAIALAIGSILGCQAPQSTTENSNTNTTPEKTTPEKTTPEKTTPEKTKTPAATEQAKTPAPISQPMTVPTSSGSSSGEPIVIVPPKEGCKISMAIVADPNPPLNVRSTPKVAEGNLAGTVDNGIYVSIAEESNGWFRITDPVEGWIAKTRTESSCANVTETIQFAPNTNSAIVRGKIIGTGSHKYLLTANKGQTIKITKLNAEGVFPTLVAPNGEVLAGDPYSDAERTEWNGTLPLAGPYSMQMESNFRGFEYEFLVEVK